MKRHVVRMLSVLSLLLPLTVALPLSARDEGENLESDIRASILKLPTYGPFEAISFQENGGTVTLSGSVLFGGLKKQAQEAVQEVPGVVVVVNDIQVLPASMTDDRLRRIVFNRIYSDGFLSRYGSPVSFRTRGFGRSRFMDVQPFGKYAIHVVVKHGRVTLYGNVDRAADRIKAEMLARGVFGVFSVDNRITVPGRTA